MDVAATELDALAGLALGLRSIRFVCAASSDLPKS
jgi:hypothetical protein